MPSRDLVRTFDRARDAYTQAVHELVPLLARMALEKVRDILPEADRLQVGGELNEDWLQILRVQRILGFDGAVLFDVDLGDADESVEAVVDHVNIEYLDLLAELTGDDFMGQHEIDVMTADLLASS